MKKRVLAAVLAAIMTIPVTVGAYNNNYLDVTKSSVGEYADSMGFYYDEFREMMNIPQEIPEWESTYVAINNIPLKSYVENSGISFDEFKEFVAMDLDESITVGEYTDMCKLGDLWGDDYESSKEYYGLGDDVTTETLYAEVRGIVNKKDMDGVERKTFTDVPYKHWAHYYISKIQESAIIDGYDDGTYLPEKAVTRAEFAKLMTVAAGLDTDGDISGYEDVNTGSWYASYVSAASRYMDGTDATHFSPEVPVSREDVATALAKLFELEPDSDNSYLAEKFTDTDSISEKNAGYVAAAVKNGIIDGFDDNTIRGNASLTRAQAATIIYRAFYTVTKALPVFEQTVITVDGIEIKLGDMIALYGVDEQVDRENDEALRELLKADIEEITGVMRYYSLAKALGKTLDDDEKQGVVSLRASVASEFGGLRTYGELLTEYASDVEFIELYIEAMTYCDKLIAEYEEGELEKLLNEHKVNINVNDEVINNLTWADILAE